MKVALLGSLEVRDGTASIGVSGGRLRALLTLLALEAPRPVTAATLVAALWGDEPPADPTNALQSLVSRLRRALGSGEIVQQSGTGYRLAVEPDAVDVHRFETLVASGRATLRAGDANSAAADLAEALALWRGEALDGVDDQSADAVRVRLEEKRHEARADLADARLALGEAALLVAELEGLVAEHPLRERYAELLVRALHASGRTAEALASYERARTTLAEALGADPSAQLHAAYLAALQGAPAPGAEPDIATGNLRATLTSFVGREEQLTQVANLLAASRLVTLVGPGGAGKTRLATASSARSDIATIWIAELAPVTDPADVPNSVLGALDLRDGILIERATSPRDAVGRLTDALSARPTLLVLDNCEHVVEAAALLADRLLAECPDLRILATSREPLGIFGEALVVVPPLELPAPDAEPKEALTCAAVQLFADRARDARAGFEVDHGTVRSVVEIVRRLDGLPFAIELAAARLRTLPVEEIERRLSDRFRLLTGGSRTAMPRHRTLHAVVDWSWDLLSTDERELAQRLAVFAGGVTPQAAAAVCAGVLDVEVVDDLLASLVDKSLLQVAPAVGGELRYRMLETIREFGLERMAEAGVVADARLAHADYFFGVVVEADRYLRTEAQLPWFEILEAERDNILAAVKYIGDLGRPEDVLDVIGLLGWHWMTLGSHSEIVTWFSFALDLPGDVPPVKRLLAEAFLAINTVAWIARAGEEEMGEAQERLRNLSVAITATVDAGTAPPMVSLLAPIVAMFTGDVATAHRLTAKVVEHEDPWVAAAGRMFGAAMAENNGDVARMRIDSETALAAFREMGERWGMANTLQIVGQLELLEGNVEAAATAYGEALDLAFAIGSREDVATMRLRLADILTRLGDVDGARRQAQLGREAADLSGSPVEVLFAGVVDVEIARTSGDLEEARRLRDHAIGALRDLPSVHPVRTHGLALMLSTAAKIELDLGNDVECVWPYLDEAYDMALGTKDMPIIAGAAVALALTLERLGEPDATAEVLGAAARLRGAEDRSQVDIVRLVEQIGELDDGPYAAAYKRGRAMTREQAIARLDPRSAR